MYSFQKIFFNSETNLFYEFVNDESSKSGIIVIIFNFNVDNMDHFTGVPTSFTHICKSLSRLFSWSIVIAQLL